MPKPVEAALSHAGPDDIRVVLVDDHRLIREGLRQILEDQPGLSVVGEADHGHGVLALLQQTPAHLVIMDLSMPGLSGMSLIRRIRQDHPGCMVLVLSMYGEEIYAMRALKAGAQGYLTKDSATDELVRAVRRVASGGCYLSRGMAEQVAMNLAHHDEGPRHERLTDRELEIFRCIVAGQRISDISRCLHLSVKTVSTHKARILQKMQLDSTAALIRYGLENRLFPEPSLERHAHSVTVPPAARAAVASPQGRLAF